MRSRVRPTRKAAAAHSAWAPGAQQRQQSPEAPGAELEDLPGATPRPPAARRRERWRPRPGFPRRAVGGHRAEWSAGSSRSWWWGARGQLQAGGVVVQPPSLVSWGIWVLAPQCESPTAMGVPWEGELGGRSLHDCQEGRALKQDVVWGQGEGHLERHFAANMPPGGMSAVGSSLTSVLWALAALGRGVGLASGLLRSLGARAHGVGHARFEAGPCPRLALSWMFTARQDVKASPHPTHPQFLGQEE